MSRIKKTSPLLNLTNFQTFILDNNPLSQYFRISELSDLLTSGKNGFLIEGSTFLKPSTEIKIEVLDTEGNPLFVQPGEGIPEYYEGLSKLITVHVYQDTPIGIGKITILGELEKYIDDDGFIQDIPEDWRGIYNIKWERDIKINKNIPNETRVRFVRKPQIIIEELNESFYSRNLVTQTQTSGLVRGVALTPSEGTQFNGYRGGVRYLIQNQSGNFFDGGTFISVTGTNLQNLEVIEYLNQNTIVVQTPFTSSAGVVSNFTDKNYTLTYQYNQNPVASPILGSFGRFEINHLQTFVGDVERIKVFKKSRASNVDYTVIQDTRVEAAELLTTIVSGSNIDTGHFSASYEGGKNWNNFWVTQSLAGASLDSSKIYRAVKLQNNRLSTNLGDDIRLESGSEYRLQFYNYYETSSNDISDTLKVYLTSTERSGSGIANYYVTQSLVTLTGSNEVRNANLRTYNFVPPITDNWTVHFEADNTTANSYWHVGSVSLQASHELGFSPDEFSFIIPIDRDLERETFDFKFEFFDINNNYVPITVVTAQTFQSGNIGLIDKSIDIDVDRQLFYFSSSANLVGSPETQQINISVTKNRILGNLLITSQAFDTGGFEIPTASNNTNPYYSASSIYPGALSSYSEGLYSASAQLLLADFSGSLHTASIVDRITYTLTETESVLPFVKRFTISRLVQGASGTDGDDAKGLFVSANTNQFIYEPTGPSLKPSGQAILIQAKRQNLESDITPITVNSSSGAPSLSVVGTSEGVTTYSLLGSNYPFSVGERTYAFTGSDFLGNDFSDFVKITPVMNFDGISVVLSNEATSFPASSSGAVNSTFLSLGDGSVNVRVGSNIIPFSDGNAVANSFDIESVSGVNCTPSSSSPGINKYGITAIDSNSDSASLNLSIKYLAGDNSTSASFSKVVSYSKAKKAAPVLEFTITNNNQSVDAKSTGAQISEFQTSSFSVREIYDGSSTIRTLSAAPTINSSSLYTRGTVTATTLALPQMTSGTNSVELYVTGSVIDGEGTSRTVFGGISLTKIKNAKPSVLVTATPQAQSVLANAAGVQTGTLSNVTISALEGNTSRFTSMTATYSGFSTNPTISSDILNTSAAVMNAAEASATIVVTHTDSEGTTGQTQTIIVRFTKVPTGQQGDQGDTGDDGRRVAAGMVHYSLASQTAPTGPDDGSTSYNFTTGVMSGMRSGWQMGAPTYAAGNSNLYWYSSFTAREDTPGSGVSTNANNTFGTVTQAIGFSGLVSFTTANGVSDGTNSLSFGVGGATLINGSNISTGRIGSTNLITGSGFQFNNGKYVQQGMLINLDSGSIHAKNFYVSSSGDAEFKGNLAVTSTLGGSAFGSLALSSSVSATTQVNGLGVLATRDSVAATHIDAGAVTEAKIGTGAVSNAKIATDAVTEAKIATDAVTSGKISANAVVADKIAANAIVADKIAANAITAGKIIAGAIEADKIATFAVTADKVVANSLTAAKISGLDFTGKTAIFTQGEIGGWTIEADRLSSPLVGGVRRLIFSPSPLIAVNNSSGEAKLTIKAGALSQLGAAGSVTLPLNSPNINISCFNDSTSQASNTIYGSENSFNVANTGTYSGNVSFGATSTLATTPSPWLGYLYVGMGIQIATDSGFSNVIVNEIISSAGIGNAGSISISAGSKAISVGFSQTGTHYVRVFWTRQLFSNTTAQTTFTSAGSTFVNSGLAQSVRATELTDEGFQVVNDTLVYFRINREGSYTGTTPYVQVGGILSATGNIIAYYSDKRLKTIEGKIDNPLEKIEKINGVYYKQNELAKEFGYNNDKRQVGLIAQEVEEILPEVVQQAPFDIDEKDGSSKSGENYLTIDYDKIVPLLVEGIKELKKEIEELKKNR